MFKVSVKVRKLVKERLAAAAEEIFELVERTIAEYEEEIRAQLYGPGGALSVGATDKVPQPPHTEEERYKERAQLLTSEDTAPSSGQSFIDNNYTDEDNNSQSEVVNLQTYQKHYLTSGAAPVLPPAEEPGPSFENPDFSINPLNSSCRPLKCPVCDQVFLTLEELDQHMSIHICPMTYDELLSLHQANIEQGRQAKKRTKKPYSCSVCGIKFNQKRYFESHMLMHKVLNRVGTKPFKCSFCKRSFYNKNRFKRHVLQHSQLQTESTRKSKRGEYKCTVCGRVFAYQSRLQKHAVVHEKDGKGLTSTSQNETHTKRNMPFSCSVCGQGFYTERLLARHKSRHPELRTSKPQSERCCAECGKVYNNRASLVKHMEMHQIESFEPSRSCLFCGEIFEEENDLQDHMAGHMPQTGVTEDTETFQVQCGKDEPEEACSGKDTMEKSSPISQETKVHPCLQRDGVFSHE